MKNLMVLLAGAFLLNPAAMAMKADQVNCYYALASENGGDLRAAKFKAIQAKPNHLAGNNFHQVAGKKNEYSILVEVETNLTDQSKILIKSSIRKGNHVVRTEGGIDELQGLKIYFGDNDLLVKCGPA